MKNVLQRTCVGCNSKKDKSELLRISKSKNGIYIDENFKLEGRGAYICKNIECLEKAIKKGRIERSLNSKINSELYEDLRSVVSGKI